MSGRRKGSGALFVNLFGGFAAAGPDPGHALLLRRKKTRALLSFLAVAPGHTVSRAKLMALLWEEEREDAARHRLRQCLLDLRQTLTKGNIAKIRTDSDLIGLEASRVIVDVTAFKQLVAQGTPEALAEAVALYRGELLEGFVVDGQAFEAWLRVEREQLKAQAVSALKRLVAHHARETGSEVAVQMALRLLAFEPYDESAHRRLMRLYADSGRRSSALRQYEQCVEILGRELGVEPEPETRELYRDVLSERGQTGTAASTVRVHRKIPTSGVAKARLSFPSPVASVGRDADLEWLDGLRGRAKQGQPQLVLVIGEAGIGKTQLVGELASHHPREAAELLLGRGRDGEDVLAFAPWIEALRPSLTDDLLRRLTPATRLDLARLFPELAGGHNPLPGGIEGGVRIFEAVADVLRELAAKSLLIVVIEDLHWCDDMATRLLRFLPRRLEGQPILLVGTVRAEEMAQSSGRGGFLETLRRDPACASRTLRPLSRDETMRLLRTLLASSAEEPADALIERVWTLSEGNPFIVIECARAVRDRSEAGQGSPLELPEQVRALTARSLGALGDMAARLADVAAVIGRDFDVAILRHAASVTDVEVTSGLEELVRRRVLREIERRFDFGHDRVREVAYERLIGPRRVLLHRQVAEALEAVYSADLAAHSAAIGAHYREAGVWPHACMYQARAGFDAENRGASREALTCFEYALEAMARLPDTEEWHELHVRLSLALNGVSLANGNYERGQHHLLLAERLAPLLPDPRWTGRVAAALASTYRAAGAVEDTILQAHRALDAARATGDPTSESMANMALGTSECSAGNYRRALKHLTSVLQSNAAFSRLDGPFTPNMGRPPNVRSSTRYWMMIAYVHLGEFDAGRHMMEEWFADGDTLDDPLGTRQLQAYISLGRLNTSTGHFDAAVRAYENGLALYRDDCQGNFYVPLAWGFGLACTLAGRVAEGVAHLDRAAIILNEMGAKPFEIFRLLRRSRALIEARRLDEAAELAHEVLRRAQTSRNSKFAASAYGLLGEVAMVRDPFDEQQMERHVVKALTLAEPLELRPLVARCHLRLAWLYERTGQPERDRHVVAASVLLDQMGKDVRLDAAGVH